MTRRRARLFSCVMAFLTIAGPAMAQIQTGGLRIRAVDEQGGVMPGVSVTITSPVLPRELLGTTDADGTYQVPGLSVGTYTIRTALQGFQTVIREGVLVRQGQIVDVDLPMRVSPLSEEVTVRSESPIIDSRSANVNVNLDKHLLENTPGGKDI